MFDVPINYSQFNTTSADMVFGRKVPVNYMRTREHDAVLTILVRALVAPRIPDGEEFTTYYGELGLESEMTDERLHRNRNLRFMQCNVNDSGVDEFYERVASSASRNGFRKLDKVSKFFERSLRVDCYINERDKRSVVVHNAKTMKERHHLLSAFLAFIPWLFKEGVSKEEMELVRGLTENTPDRFMAAVDVLASKLDFRTSAIKTALAGFESAGIRTEIARAGDKLVDIIERIKSIQNELNDILEEKSRTEALLLGYERKLGGTSDGALAEYFMTCKNLELYDWADNRITFIVRGHLTYWNEEDARAIIDNTRGFAYLGSRPTNDTYMLMKAVFLDQTVRIRMCAAYTLGSSWASAGGYDYAREETYTPNPHIYYHSCLGGFEHEISKCLIDGDYVGAVESAVASCSSVNLLEAPTARPFLQDVFYTGKRVFEMSDGRILSADEAIAALKEGPGNA